MALDLAKDIRTIPNLISLSRIVLMVIATTLYFRSHMGWALGIGIAAALTDYLDGYVARRTGMVTRLGEILDQFSDLCYESTALTILIHNGFLPPYSILVYAYREFWTLSVRRYMAGVGKNIPSSWLGKAKTNFLMWGLLPSFLSLSTALPQWHPVLRTAGQVMLWTALGLSFLSGIGYTKAFVLGYEGATPPATGGA